MKYLILFLALVASVWLGVLMHGTPGYVLIAYSKWSIELSLWLALFSVLILFVLLHGVFSVSTKLQLWVRQFSQWRKNRKLHTMLKGCYALLEGKWRSAEKKLLKATKNPKLASLNYLIAAYAAQQHQALERRDHYLYLAQKLSPTKAIAPLIAQAELLVMSNQLEEALAILEQLPPLRPILKLRYTIYVKLQAWQALQKLLPKLWRYQILDLPAYAEVELQVYGALCQQSLAQQQAARFWHSLPRHLKYHSKLLTPYLEQLLATHNHQHAEKLLTKALDTNWQPDLLKYYATLKTPKPLKHLKRAELWLKKHPYDTALLICVAQICKQQQLWGQARYYLEKSLKIAITAAAYYELGALMELQQQPLKALQYYKQAWLHTA